jgi:hypothetical protein
MARPTRKNYSKEFKLEAVHQLNVADQNISRWVTAYGQSLQIELSGERPRSEL